MAFPIDEGTSYLDLQELGSPASRLSIAGRFDLDIYALNLSGVCDSKLAKLFAELPPHCVILLEDVDAVSMARRRNTDACQKQNSGVTLSGPLNALDGVSSQEGRVLIMTTNHIEHLDDALIRPGRVDKKVYFKLVDKHITAQLFRTIFKQMPDINKESKCGIHGETVDKLANEFAAKVPEQTFRRAEVLSFLFERKASPIDAVAEVENWVFKAKKVTSQ